MTLKAYTLAEVLELAHKRPRWIIEDIWAYEPTLLWGRSEQGKSFLAVAMLKALLCDDKTYLGKNVAPGDWRAVVVVTDPGDHVEYARRIEAVLPPASLGDGPRVKILLIPGRSLSVDDWRDLQDYVKSGYNLVVIDNVNGAIEGEANENQAARRFFDRIANLYDAGAEGVLIVHHESEKWQPDSTATPMSNSQFVSTSRWRIRVKKTGDTTRLLHFEGNVGPEHEMIVHTPGDRAVFELMEGKDSRALGAEKATRQRERKQTRADVARVVVRHILASPEARSKTSVNALADWLLGNPPKGMKAKPSSAAWRMWLNRECLGKAGLLREPDVSGFQAGERLNG